MGCGSLGVYSKDPFILMNECTMLNNVMQTSLLYVLLKCVLKAMGGSNQFGLHAL